MLPEIEKKPNPTPTASSLLHNIGTPCVYLYWRKGSSGQFPPYTATAAARWCPFLARSVIPHPEGDAFGGGPGTVWCLENVGVWWRRVLHVAYPLQRQHCISSVPIGLPHCQTNSQFDHPGTTPGRWDLMSTLQVHANWCAQTAACIHCWWAGSSSGHTMQQQIVH